MKNRIWEVRAYRPKSERLRNFSAAVGESELYFSAARNLSAEALELIRKYRREIESYIIIRPDFLESLVPLPDDERAPRIVREMLRHSASCGVGPMAGVAGAVAEFVGRDLLAFTDEIIVENGGDVFMSVKDDKTAALDFASGFPPITIKIPAGRPVGLATSSGRRGHSLSFGSADAVTVISSNAALADCAATSLANAVTAAGDIERVLAAGLRIPLVAGIVIVCDGKIGIRGDIEMV